MKYTRLFLKYVRLFWGLVLLACLSLTAHAQPQSQPVNVQVVASPPYSTFLNDYQTGANLMVSLIQRDLSLPPLQVYLHIELEGAGIRLKTLPSYRPNGYIALDLGTPVILTNNDLAEYLSVQNLSFEGIGKESFLAGGQQLPQGMYKLKVTAMNPLTGGAVSNQVMTMMGIYKGQPPLINLPFANKIIPANDLQTFAIQWTNRNSAAFNASNTASYRLQIWELPETALDPNVIVGSNYPTILDEYLTNTTYQYGPANPVLIPGMSYAVRVQAVDASGRDLFSNSGYSQVVKFTYGGGCVAPTNVTSRAEGSNIVLNWTAVGTKGYTVKYRRVDQVDTTFEDVLLNGLTVRNLPPNAQYFFQVATLCDGDKLSAYSKPISIYTLPEDANNLANCGAKAPKVNLNNRDLLPSLKVGDVFTSYDFRIKVTRIDRNDPNGFVGEGTTEVKMLGNLNTVVAFNGIKINTDYVQIEGRVNFQQKPYVFSDERLNDFADDLKKSTQDNDVVNTAVPIEIEVNGTVSGITLSSDRKSNTITYVDEKGKIQTKVLEVGKDYKVMDKTGDVYLIAKDGSVAKQAKATALQVNDAPNTDGGQSAKLYFADSSLVLSFLAHPSQTLGFDDPAAKSAPEAGYEQIRTGEGNRYLVPWLSVAAGSTTTVRANILTNPKAIPLESIKFKTNAGQEVKADYDATAKEWVLTVQGTLHRQNFSIYPYYKKEEEEEVICGKLNVMPLDKKTVNLVLVPLKGFDPSSLRREELEAYLNNVYGVANTTIHVIQNEPFLDPLAEQPLAVEHGKLADYSPNQAALILAFQQTMGEPADNTFYLFLSPQASPSGQAIKGHAPINRSFGFLYNTTDKRTIAHELAHGYPMALEHGFQDISMGNEYQNLLYYNTSAQLDHTQWSLIHQPKLKIRTGGEEDKSIKSANSSAFVAELLNQLRNAYAHNTDFLNNKNNKLVKIDLDELLKKYNLTGKRYVTTDTIQINGVKFDKILVELPKYNTPITLGQYSIFKSLKKFSNEESRHRVVVSNSNTDDRSNYKASDYDLNMTGYLVRLGSSEKERTEYGQLELIKYIMTPAKNTDEDHLVLFVNGYKLNNAVEDIPYLAEEYYKHLSQIYKIAIIPDELPNSANEVHYNLDFTNYWEGIDELFLERLTAKGKSPNAVYADGHMDIVTSNHRQTNLSATSKINFGVSLVSSLCALDGKAALEMNLFHTAVVGCQVNSAWALTNPIPYFATCGMVLGFWGLLPSPIQDAIAACKSCKLKEAKVQLHTTPNVDGFNTRLQAGTVAGKRMVAKIKSGEIPFYKDDKGNFKGSIDIVAHSMGYAYSLGMLYELNKAFPNVAYDRFYIIAPENACSGTYELSMFNEVWQYGSREDEEGDKTYKQDGIAPQCAVYGLTWKGKKGRIGGRIPFQGPEENKNFLDAHSVKSYDWIFDGTITTNRDGYVKNR